MLKIYVSFFIIFMEFIFMDTVLLGPSYRPPNIRRLRTRRVVGKLTRMTFCWSLYRISRSYRVTVVLSDVLRGMTLIVAATDATRKPQSPPYAFPNRGEHASSSSSSSSGLGCGCIRILDYVTFRNLIGMDGSRSLIEWCAFDRLRIRLFRWRFVSASQRCQHRVYSRFSIISSTTLSTSP